MQDDATKPLRPPTVKESKFVLEYIRTGNASEAYRLSYDAKNMLPATIASEASRMLKAPHISAMIDTELSRALAPARLTAADVLSRAWEIASSDATDRTRGLAIAAKAFPEFRDVTIDQSQHVHLPDGLSLDDLRKLARGDSESGEPQ